MGLQQRVERGDRSLSPVQRQTLINILQAEAEAWDTGREREQDSPVFLSSWVSDCADAGHHTAAASLRILGSATSGSLKITCAINKQTEAITGRQRRGIGLGQDERRSHWSLNWWAAALQRQQRYQCLLTDPSYPPHPKPAASQGDNTPLCVCMDLCVVGLHMCRPVGICVGGCALGLQHLEKTGLNAFILTNIANMIIHIIIINYVKHLHGGTFLRGCSF